MKFEDVLRDSRRVCPEPAALERWKRSVFAPADLPGVPGWVPSLASVTAMAAMLVLLWPAAARGPVVLRAAGEACDGRWEQMQPLRADLRGIAQPVPSVTPFAAPDQCALCHLGSIRN